MLAIKRSTPSNLKNLLRIVRRSKYVDMHCRADSLAGPLYSDHFANCLCVIVHNAENSTGSLMHIFPASGGGLDAHALFYYADKQIEKVLKKFSGSQKIQLLLWKGISYTPEVMSQLSMSYAEYAREKFKGRVENVIDLMDGKKSTKESKIIYYPLNNKVYIIDFAHSDYFNGVRPSDDGAIQLPVWRQRDIRLSPRTHANIELILNKNFRKSSVGDDEEFGEWIGASASSENLFRNIQL